MILEFTIKLKLVLYNNIEINFILLLFRMDTFSRIHYFMIKIYYTLFCEIITCL